MRVLVLMAFIFIIPTAAYFLYKLSERVKSLRAVQRELEEKAARRDLYIHDIENENIRKYEDG